MTILVVCVIKLIMLNSGGNISWTYSLHSLQYHPSLFKYQALHNLHPVFIDHPLHYNLYISPSYFCLYVYAISTCLLWHSISIPGYMKSIVTLTPCIHPFFSAHLCAISFHHCDVRMPSHNFAHKLQVMHLHLILKIYCIAILAIWCSVWLFYGKQFYSFNQ